MISPKLRAIEQSAYLLQRIEEGNRQANSFKTVSIFNLLKKFHLSNKERENALKNKGFFDRLHFYCIGENQMINKKIKRRVKFERALKNFLLDKIAILNPSAAVKENISEIYVYKKNILENLISVNKIAKGATFALLGLTTFWISYNAMHFRADFDKYCTADTEQEELKMFLESQCPTHDFPNYFYNLNLKFFALPTLLALGVILQQLESELLSRFIFSPLDNVRKSASAITEKVSRVKDFLLEKALEPKT